MVEELLKEGLTKETKQIIPSIEQDDYCIKIVDIFSNVPLSPKLVRELHKIESKFIKDTSFFKINGNIQLLHDCLTNQRGCAVYLLLDEGYNIAQMTKQIVGKSRRHPKNSRNSIRILIKKFEKLSLARKSGLSGEQEKVYEKVYDNKELVQALNYLCLRNLRMATTDIIRSNIPEEILKRNYI